MNILAIEVTAEIGSIALVRDDAVLEEVVMQPAEGFGPVLFTEIAALLTRHGLRVADIDGFACGTGPGQFTGVRLAVTAAKGLAESAGKPMAGVSNLRAMAFYGEAHRRAVLLDARRGDVYAGLYDASLQPLRDEVVTQLPAWLASLPEGVNEFLGWNLEPYAADLAGFTMKHAPRALAGAVGVIAARDGMWLDPAAVDANYVRRSDAELSLKEAV